MESTNLCVALWALVDLWAKSRGSPWLCLQCGTAVQLGFCPFLWWCPLSPLHQSVASERTMAGANPCSVPTASSFCWVSSPLQHPHHATSPHRTGLSSIWLLWPLQKTALITPKDERDAHLSCPFSFPDCVNPMSLVSLSASFQACWPPCSTSFDASDHPTWGGFRARQNMGYASGIKSRQQLFHPHCQNKGTEYMLYTIASN